MSRQTKAQLPPETAPRLLHKGFRPFIFRDTLYLPISLFLLDELGEHGTARRVTATLRVGAYETTLSIPVFAKRTTVGILSSLRIITIPLNEIGSATNTRIIVSISLGTTVLTKRLTYRADRHAGNTRLYYLPFSVRKNYRTGFCRHLRRSASGVIVIMQRNLKPLEKTPGFRFIESWPIGALLYCAGSIVRAVSPHKTLLFYEKFASKAEEGTYELFTMARALQEAADKHTGGKNSALAFIIDQQSRDYERIKGSGVVPKFSFRYYWLIYRASAFVGTEVPSHLHFLRSNNRWLRLCFYTRTFVFLQHGITYLKPQEKTSAFVRGREGAADYIVADSRKERTVLMHDLHYDEEQILITGLGQFSQMEYEHIKENSPDTVTIMFTWKPYDDSLAFSQSTNYATLQQVLRLVQRHVPNERIRLVVHPKELYSLDSESELPIPFCTQPIHEILAETKLLITDYSSVCYSSFYQGGAVLFYQPDLEHYEKAVGTLIPQADEYIGYRNFKIEELEQLLTKAIDQNGHIKRELLRTKQHEAAYQSINEFNDGQNLHRILHELQRLELL
ncbi:MAG: CDP-glycerol glycerophosphotransferase family protein [Coriobacteriales bacterium]|nr:CDP-glycerol glycerophosphotransferase family protein [Coriobacteriales bacterium]